MSKQRFTYSVYRRKTGMPVIIGGTYRECAAVMGITPKSFREIYSRFKNNSTTTGHRWEIYRDDPDEDMED